LRCFPTKTLSSINPWARFAPLIFLIVDLGAADKGRILWTEAGKMDSLESYLEHLETFLSKAGAQ
jgi:hypothetical protein